MRNLTIVPSTLVKRPLLALIIIGGALALSLGWYTGRAQSASVVFAAGGDHGSPNEPGSRSSFQAIADSGAEFYLALGDMSYEGSGPEPTDGVTPSPWCSGSDPNRNIKLTIGETFPFQLLVGNHEDDNREDGFIKNFAVCLPDRMNSTGVYGAEYYFDYPPTAPLLRVIMIGAGNDVDGEQYDYIAGNAHYNWLSNTIDQARAQDIPWVVVGMHKPCITMGNKDCEVSEDVMDLLIAKRVDVVLQGHDHDYQRSKQLVCADANRFEPACVADDGADGTYIRGAGTVFVINGNFGGGGFTPIDCSDSERNYFARAMGGDGLVWNGSGCSTALVGRGILLFMATADRLEGQFAMTYEIAGSGDPFTDNFVILNDGSTPPPTPVPTSIPPISIVTTTASADSYVYSSKKSSNYGSSSTLHTDAAPEMRSYLRFDVPPLTGSVTHATLRVYAETSSPEGYTLYTTGSNWTESTITYNNAPAGSAAIGASGPFNSGTWTTIDVTPYISGSGSYNLMLVPQHGTVVRYSSREGSRPPELVIEVKNAPPPTAIPTGTPTDTATPTLTDTSTDTPTDTHIPTGTPSDTPSDIPAPPTLQPIPNVVDPAALVFHWTLEGAATASTWIHLQVFEMNRNNTLGPLAYNVWQRRDQVCGSFSSTICSFDPPVNLRTGRRYGLVAEAWGPGGMSATKSGPETFNIGGDPPAIPNVTVDTSQVVPTLTWDDDNTAHWFQIIIVGGGQTRYNKWHGRSSGDNPVSCSGTTCTFTPPALVLPNGDYTAWMQAWSPGGFSFGGDNAGWGSDPFTVAFDAPAAPAVSADPFFVDPAAVTVAGDLSGTASTAAWIHLQVSRVGRNGEPGVLAYNVWRRRDQVCGSFAGTNCVFPVSGLAVGRQYQARMESWGSGGMSAAFSAPVSFCVGGECPALVNISNVVTDSAPSSLTIEWADDPSATWFHVVIVQHGAGSIHNGWHGRSEGNAQAACDGTICSVTVAGNFTAGDYTVWMEAWGPGGFTVGGDFAGWTSFPFSIAP